jgi:hypothetical protein
MPDKWSQYAVGTASSGDPWSQYAQPQVQQVGPTPPGLQGTISSAPPPSLFERARRTVANSAIGHALEQGLPSVADALNLHPTETVNSPTYQQHSQQLIAPDYMAPNSPATSAGRITKGALRGVGGMTSGSNMATGVGVAATGGLLAPLAGASGIARLAPGAFNLGAGSVGLRGVGQGLSNAYNQYVNGDQAGAEESLGETLPNAALMIPFAKGALSNAKSGVKEWFAPSENLDYKSPSDSFSKRELYNIAKNNGIQLDAAQATGSGPANFAKRVSEHSLTGKGVYENAQKNNNEGLLNWSNQLLDSATPNSMSREDFGKASQDMLAAHQQQQIDEANQRYQDISKNYGSTAVVPTYTQDAAGRIIAGNNDFFQQNPQHLKMGGMQRVYNLVKENAPPSMQPQIQTGLFDLSGNEVTKAPTSKPQPLADLITKRSDIMNDYRSPDSVGTRAEGFQKQLVGGLDQDIMDSLPKTGQNEFRNTNALWTKMHNTYQNPSSPFTQILRSPSPTQIAGTIDALPTEMTRQFKTAASTVNSDLNQQLARQKMDRILDPNGTGTPDLRNLPTRVGRLNDEKTAEVLTPDQIKNLRAIGQTSRVTNFDSNPSGSGKAIQAYSEGTGLIGSGVAALLGHPLPLLGSLGELAGTRAAAKLVNSPKFTDWLMSNSAPAKPISPFVSGAVVASRPKKKNLFTAPQPAQ